MNEVAIEHTHDADAEYQPRHDERGKPITHAREHRYTY